MPLIADNEPHVQTHELLCRRVPFPAGRPRPGGTPPADIGRARVETIPVRRSVREFTDRPVDPDELLGVLDAAEHQQAAQWPGSRHGWPGLSVLIGAHAVAGVSPGLYSRRPAAREFGEVLRLGPIEDLCDDYARAPVILLVCGPLRATPGAAYGNLLVRAGALGYSIWLTALTAGLSCSVFGAGSPSVNRLTGRDPVHLFTIALGYGTGERG